MKQTILDELEALSSHYPRPNRSPEEHMRWLRDYADDLGNIPADAVTRACRSWRQSGKERFPNPGQLVALAQSLIPRTDVKDVAAWAPVEDATYESLSLEDKARHQMILGNRAQMRAGPMMRNGVLLKPEDMGAEWHHLRNQAKWHFEEAGKLRGFKHDRPRVSARGRGA